MRESWAGFFDKRRRRDDERLSSGPFGSRLSPPALMPYRYGRDTLNKLSDRTVGFRLFLLLLLPLSYYIERNY